MNVATVSTFGRIISDCQSSMCGLKELCAEQKTRKSVPVHPRHVEDFVGTQDLIVRDERDVELRSLRLIEGIEDLTAKRELTDCATEGAAGELTSLVHGTGLDLQDEASVHEGELRSSVRNDRNVVGLIQVVEGQVPAPERRRDLGADVPVA